MLDLEAANNRIQKSRGGRVVQLVGRISAASERSVAAREFPVRPPTNSGGITTTCLEAEERMLKGRFGGKPIYRSRGTPISPESFLSVSCRQIHQSPSPEAHCAQTERPGP